MNAKNTLMIYTVSHFAIDFCCFYLLTGPLKAQTTDLSTLAALYLCYNMIAFGLQFLFGYLCDLKKTEPQTVSALGCFLTVFALALPSAALSMFICALGNAMFHAGGGVDSLRAGSGCTRLGVFVSAGALGVGLGTAAPPSLPFLWLLPLLCGVLIYRFCRTTDVRITDDAGIAPYGTAVLLLLCLSTVIRSLSGAIIPTPWKRGVFLMLLPSISAFLGKLIGGFAADKLGARRLSVAALLLSAPLLCFGYPHVVPCAFGLLLFNMSMAPVTRALYLQMPSLPGVAFGLSTVALLLGVLPTFFFRIPKTPLLYGPLIVLSALCLCLSLKNNRPKKEPVKRAQSETGRPR